MPTTFRTIVQGAEQTLRFEVRRQPPLWSRFTDYVSGDFVRVPGGIYTATQSSPTGRPGVAGSVGWAEDSGRYDPDSVTLLFTDAAGDTTEHVVGEPGSILYHDGDGLFRARIPTTAEGPALASGQSYWPILARLVTVDATRGNGAAEWVGHVTPAVATAP